MYPTTPYTPTADETAVTSTSAEFTVLKMVVNEYYEYVSNTNSWIAQGIIDTVFTSANNAFTVVAGHKLRVGTPVQLTAGTSLPQGLSTATTYYAIVLSPTTFQLATTYANAVAGTAVLTLYTLALATKTTDIDTVLKSVSSTVAPTIVINGGAGAKAGTLVEAGTTATFTLKTATSTVADFEALVATSTLVAVLTSGTGANVFVTATDAVTATLLSDAGAGTLTAKTVATLAAGSMYVPANTPRLLAGSNGPQLAVIRDTADGKASLAEVQI